MPLVQRIGIYRIAQRMKQEGACALSTKVTTSVQPMMNRFLDNPDYPEDLFLTGAQAAELVGCQHYAGRGRCKTGQASPMRRNLLKLVKTIVVMDHHRQSSEVISNAVLSYVEPYASQPVRW